MKTNNKFIYALTAVVLSAMITYGCKKKNEGTTTTTTTTNATVSFKNDVLPIFQSNCVRCHNGGQNPTLNSFSTISVAASVSLSAIQAGRMPKGGPKLSDSDITALQNWISQGKKDN